MTFEDRIGQVLGAARFLSRLPLPETAAPLPSLAVTLRAAPVAGLLIAAGPALVLVLAARFGLPSLAVAALAIAALVVVTGGLHEDGLADVADGFGGGRTVTRKLAIMRDSRIGSYGALALGLALVLRVAALQGLIGRVGPGAAALVFLGAAAWSRGLMLLPLDLLPPARADGLGQAAGADGPSGLAAALLGAGLLGAALPACGCADGLQILAALLASAAAALGVTRLARHHIRGVTGDLVGAGQQAAEVTYLLVLSATVPLG
ncbi:adenosylcobinamide-GDP ribazoletransferase [Lichenihabitans sp. Uapishka_5]|uniref:adenosylcobinamide-GDP ribazoletransferase n=1 Tax=Lichenihabitans sp. Uapishka_5 TaxID=3037302 RepID=UPI0029E7D544|nr:adenosylcobinamide-GDP ribazoletransferase [Lichenihabitans sp. Uapishka_5]MDX7952310.1 adenosylcobinamide-GDP ribazoletransferase [Lichenihabitans sp. Uapishka_5]